MMFIILKEEFH